MMTQSDRPAIPAATLVVVRDATPAAEILMVERAAGLAFAGGALVFPGGRVDAGDGIVAADPHLAGGGPDDPDDAAARVAAIRETVEEAGIAVAFASATARPAAAALRAGLLAGEPFAALLRAGGHRLDLSALEPWARWRPDMPVPRLFDTRFYLAAAPADAPPPLTDAGETVRAFWASAATVLDRADSGEASIIYPTRRNLERIAAHRDHGALVTHARAHRVATITPWREERAGEPHLCIPEDAGYPVTAEPLARVRRG